PGRPEPRLDTTSIVQRTVSVHRPIAEGVGMGARTTGLIMIFAAIATNAVFLALTSVFGYPDVLRQEPATILGEFRAHQTAVVALFAALAALSALLIPI